MQPKKVLYQYLADLMGEPDTGKLPAGRVAGNTDTEERTTATSVCGDELQVNPTAAGVELDAVDLSAGERATSRFNAEESREAEAVSPGIPDWAVEQFQVLMVRVCGVDLAVPLYYLNSIVRWNGQATSIPGQPGWQRGLYLYKQKKVSLVNLSGLIMPERDAADSAAQPGYLLLVGRSRWGLICDSIQRPRLVRAADVRWSRNRQFRPWSHGIIVENLSVLLNIDALLTIMGTNDA